MMKALLDTTVLVDELVSFPDIGARTDARPRPEAGAPA